ncbi:DUF6879 family protein [Streptomyces antibioticus]|uniref:DUF6879 family protein n=1 Tax=Streptomyces antibioticus TaxID=1890 RepID=UPI0033B3DCC2
MPSSAPPFNELMARCERSAVHLEMRDGHAVDRRAGFRHDPADRAAWWAPGRASSKGTVGRGIAVRRACIVSEPGSDYTRFLSDGTFPNAAAGEQVRWLPRRRASDIALPGKDFWLFDDHVIPSVGKEASDDPAAPKLCVTVLDEVWAKAVAHDQYEIH